jgi:hypothetical protein
MTHHCQLKTISTPGNADYRKASNASPNMRNATSFMPPLKFVFFAPPVDSTGVVTVTLAGVPIMVAIPVASFVVVMPIKLRMKDPIGSVATSLMVS